MNVKPIDKKEAEMLSELRRIKRITKSPSDKMLSSNQEKNK